MSDMGYRRERILHDDGAWSTAHHVHIPAHQLKFEDLHPISSYVRQQDIARMHYARARARGEEQPRILTWTAMQTDRRASQLFPNLRAIAEDGENLISANSFITYVLRKLLANGWLQLHEYIGDTYEWVCDIPADHAAWREPAQAVLRWLEDAIQLDLYPNIGRGSYAPRHFPAFDARRDFVRIGRCDFVRNFAQNHARQAVFNTSHYLHEHDDLISHHSGYGDAIGLMAAANTILRPPIYRRGALLFDGENWRIDNMGLEAIRLILPGDITLSADASADYRFVVNPRQPVPIALHTRAGSLREAERPLQRSPESSNRLEFILVNRQFVSWKRGGGLAIPQNGFALSVAEGALPKAVTEQIIEDAWVEYSFGDGVGDIQSGIQAGPILLAGGEPVADIAGAQEEFWASRGATVGISPVRMDQAGMSKRKARSALGIKADGNLLLLMVDGCEEASRSDSDSAGASLAEMIALLRRAGAVDALNLSGEGSCHLFVQGGLANRPSDRRGQAGVVFERMLPSIGIVG